MRGGQLSVRVAKFSDSIIAINGVALCYNAVISRFLKVVTNGSRVFEMDGFRHDESIGLLRRIGR